jgi:ATP phosphoribosyltransferase regulatory subunit
MHRQLLTPKGVRDYLPEEATWRRELENKINQVFTSYGYQEVVTPTVEYVGIFTPSNAANDAQTYRFVDREGQILALRPDMTTPIARVVASRLQNQPLPLRLCYFGNLFRYEDPQAGRQREFTQAGLELLGSNNSAADAEVVILACKCLAAVGVRDFRIDIGHVGFVRTLLSMAGFLPETEERVKEALVHKDLVALEQLVTEQVSDPKLKEVMLEIMEYRGGPEVLEKAQSAWPNLSIPALTELSAVFQRVKSAGLENYVIIDLSMVKEMDYYTGIILEGYSRELGYYLCSGGRYDGLLGEFGYDIPATGFALGLDRVLLVLERQGFGGWKERPKFIVDFPGADYSENIEWVERWRSAGAIVVDGFDTEYSSQHCDAYLQFTKDGRVIYRDNVSERIIDPNEILSELITRSQNS